MCLVGVVVCLWLSRWSPWALAGAAVFLFGFLFVLWVWQGGVSARNRMDAPPARIAWKSDAGSLDLSLPVDDPKVMARRVLGIIRKLVQSREIPPAPRGSVLGNPSHEADLKEYSDEERKSIEEKWKREIPEHDQAAVEKLASAVRNLEDSSSPIERPTKAVPGLPQAKPFGPRKAIRGESTAGPAPAPPREGDDPGQVR